MAELQDALAGLHLKSRYEPVQFAATLDDNTGGGQDMCVLGGGGNCAADKFRKIGRAQRFAVTQRR